MIFSPDRGRRSTFEVVPILRISMLGLRELHGFRILSHLGMFSLLTLACCCTPRSAGQFGLDSKTNTPYVSHRRPVDSTHAGARTILIPDPNDKASSELAKGQTTQAPSRETPRKPKKSCSKSHTLLRPRHGSPHLPPTRFPPMQL